MTAVEPPQGLGRAGSALWKQMVSPDLEFSESELVTATLACRQADDLAALEALLAERGMVTVGSKGQPRLSPIVSELRQQRLTLNRLVAALSAPEPGEDAALTSAQRKARRAAEARWDRSKYA